MPWTCEKNAWYQRRASWPQTLRASSPRWTSWWPASSRRRASSPHLPPNPPPPRAPPRALPLPRPRAHAPPRRPPRLERPHPLRQQARTSRLRPLPRPRRQSISPRRALLQPYRPLPGLHCPCEWHPPTERQCGPSRPTHPVPQRQDAPPPWRAHRRTSPRPWFVPPPQQECRGPAKDAAWPARAAPRHRQGPRRPSWRPPVRPPQSTRHADGQGHPRRAGTEGAALPPPATSPSCDQRQRPSTRT